MEMTSTTTTTCVEDLLLNPDPSEVHPAKSTKRATKSTGPLSGAAHATADALGLLREWAKVFTLTASHCACCGKDLRDAVSVTRGIGPDCSREHYDIDFEITDDMVAKALGRLVASHLDDRIKRAVRDLKDKPRDLCNILVWWSSVNLNQVETVLECAEVVTLLGFVTLGDRLRERNTNVIISKTPEGDYIVRCKSRHRVMLHMQQVREATTVRREGRFKAGWKFPASRKELVWTILGEDFGNEWATVPALDDGAGRIIKIPAKTYWDVRQAFNLAYNPPAPVTRVTPVPVVAAFMSKAAAPAAQTIVRLVTNGIEVHTPSRNWDFVSELKLLPYQDRRWDPTAGCWRVALKHEAKIRQLVAAHFNGAV